MSANFSQLDKRWSGLFLGSSGLTIGGYGCTTVCLTDIANDFGNKITPKEAVKKLNYTKDGKILWQSVANIGLKFEWRGYNFNQAQVDKMLQVPDKRVLLEISTPNPGLRHWVLINEKDDGYRVRNPYGGFIDTMPNPVNRTITGYAVISGTPVIDDGSWIASKAKSTGDWIKARVRQAGDWITSRQ